MCERIKNLVRENPYLENATFIVGAGRSGTTLMQSLLDNHPQLNVWPIEFGYYLIFNDFIHKNGIKGPVKASKLNDFFFNTNIKNFGKESGNGESYSLKKIDIARFKSVMRVYGQEIVSRKEYLQLLVYAFQQSYNPHQKPDRFLIKMINPGDAPILDFTNAKFLNLSRHPISTYVSHKEFYFTAYAKFPWFVYNPRVAIGRFRWGLLEISAAPVLYAFDWLERNKENRELLVVKLERLQKYTENTMREIANFLNISFTSSLLEQTMLGIIYGSNMTSGFNSKGRVVKQEQKKFMNELTNYELHWVSCLFDDIMLKNDYCFTPEYKLSKWHSFCGFWKPLKNELPVTRKIGTSSKYVNIPVSVVVIYSWLRTLSNYLTNRFFFLTYQEISFLNITEVKIFLVNYIKFFIFK